MQFFPGYFVYVPHLPSQSNACVLIEKNAKTTATTDTTDTLDTTDTINPQFKNIIPFKNSTTKHPYYCCV